MLEKKNEHRENENTLNYNIFLLVKIEKSIYRLWLARTSDSLPLRFFFIDLKQLFHFL